MREILQQPATWLITAKQASALLVDLKHFTDGVAAVILTGSGSSEYAGDCSRPMLQRRLAITVQVTGSGTILTDGIDLLAPERPALMISFARSGDSPESVAALLKVSEADTAVRQLVITCNANGQLAAKAKMDANVHAVVLDDRTNDRSLVMTSSFTNMVLTAMSLGWSANPSEFISFAEQLSQTAERLLDDAFQRLPKIARLPFHRAFYLADASAFGAARESALKMTEMTAGRVMTTSETYLGLRHGPMSAIDPNTLVVCFLSSEPVRRAYEIDLISELNAKKLGLRKILVGANIPQDLLNDGDLAFEDNGFVAAGDDGCSLLHVLIGQVLAFYRCMHEGLKPDAPSATGVISRVVQKFRLHGISTAG
ncbi:MAG: SIS domain-containing protein [Edaphobacter sp.]|uniref:SIS domain-containing protein n=1 Tax=Edaphobacter sp. TaxID=1934404 RepID=UPI0023980C1F|nr:SIS domain-containing protein [Edaphobacter sp.]MDE1176453.1 SIS domain-containing protein [Edaphobacter sp.]